MKFVSVLWFLVLALLVSSCQKKVETAADGGSKKVEPNLLATGNGKKITESDLALMEEKYFSNIVAGDRIEQVKAKALESMVMMMAIAQEAESKLTAEQRLAVNTKLTRYKEELLVDVYLRNSANVVPPNESEMLDFYNKNKNLYGEKTVKTFEILRVTGVSNNKLPVHLKALEEYRSKEQWANLPSGYERLESSTGTSGLSSTITNAVASLAKGQVSKVVYLNKMPQIVRVMEELELPARPFPEVRERIRKTLAAKKLKLELKRISNDLLAKADVKYF